MVKLSALKMGLKVKSKFPRKFLNLKISAIIRDTQLKLSVLVLIVSRERRVSQISYLGPSFCFMKR